MKIFENPVNMLRLLKVNLFVQSAIIVTGAIVRITKSGLGCPTWPKCVGDSIIPVANQVESWHKYIEFGNRILTFVLLIVAALVVISIWRNTSLKKLRKLSIAPVAGTFIQAILGGITVLTGLHPTTVAAHFLFSILIVAFSHQLLRQYMSIDQVKSRNLLANILIGNAFISLILGTLVTGSGPHSGDLYASSRFGFDLTTVANIHSKSIWVFCILLLFIANREYMISGKNVQKSFHILSSIVVIQGFIGYYQFSQGVPELPVFLHIIGSVVFWIAALRLRFDLKLLQN